jgi:hypothetical protein
VELDTPEPSGITGPNNVVHWLVTEYAQDRGPPCRGDDLSGAISPHHPGSTRKNDTQK